MQTLVREKTVMREKEGVSLEHRLLLLFARLDLTPAHVSLIRELMKVESLNWSDFVHNVRWHRLGGLTYHHMQSNGLIDYAPENTKTLLESDYVENSIKNLYLRSELRKVLGELRSCGIPVIVLKGSALLEQIYGNASIRTMSGLDLLVPEELAERAQARVINLGYTPTGSEDEQMRTREEHRHLPFLVDSEGIATVGIHSHIVSKSSPLRFSLAGFWARANRSTLADEEVLTLVPEDMLVHLAIHFFLDRRFRSYAALGQICDMAEVIRAYQRDFDWDGLIARVNKDRVRGPVYCGLSLARELLDAPVPDDVLTSLRPSVYSDELAVQFMQRRVLDSRPILVTNLISPVTAYSLPTLLKNLVGGVFTSKIYMSKNMFYLAPKICIPLTCKG